MIDLAGKTAVVFGLANKRSIAWGIAQKLHAAGATLAICYQNERMKLEAEGLIADLPGAAGFQCDVSNDAGNRLPSSPLSKPSTASSTSWCTPSPSLPPLILKANSSIPAAKASASRMEVSVYSLIAVSRGAAPLMTDGGSIMTLTYYAAEKVVPNYNVMAVAKAASSLPPATSPPNLGPKNIRVNAISAGPIKTLAARGIGDLGEMMQGPRRARPAAPQRRPARSRRSGPLSGQRPLQRHHRRNHLRRLRLQHHGVLTLCRVTSPRAADPLLK